MRKLINFIKSNKLVSIVIGIIFIGFVLNSYSSCSLNRIVKKGEKEYNQLRKEKASNEKLYDAELKQLREEREELDAKTEADDIEINALHKLNEQNYDEYVAESAKKSRTITQERRRGEIARGLIEDIRLEVTLLTQAVTDTNGKVKNLELQLTIVNKKYNDEKELRLKCEGQYKLLKLSIVVPKLSLWKRFDYGLFGGISVSAGGELDFAVGFGILFKLNK